jgi:hypothetical protein
MGDIRSQGVLVDIIITHYDTLLEGNMCIQGQKADPVCPLSEIKEGGRSKIFCKEILGK